MPYLHERASGAVRSTLHDVPLSADFAVVAPVRTRITRATPGLDENLQRLIGNFGCQEFLRLRDPVGGRSAVVVVDGRLIKVKGLFGLRRRTAQQWEIVPRAPASPYRTTPEFHLFLDETLSLTGKAGRPKSLYSMPASGAEREFDCQAALAAQHIGVTPLGVVRFLSATGDPILDCQGDATGAVVLGWEGSIRPAATGIYGRMFRDDTTSPGRGFEHRTVTDDEYEGELRRVERVYGAVGDARRQAVLNCGVLRHSGHLENFLLDGGGRVLVMDTDTCRRTEEFTPPARASQLVRDMLSDLLRLLSTISILHWNRPFREALARGAFDPLGAYLTGFWADRLPEATVTATARALRTGYAAWLDAHYGSLASLSAQYVPECTEGAPHRTGTGSRWRLLHALFAPQALAVLCGLLWEADLGPEYRLARRPLDDLRVTWHEDANRYVRLFL